MRRRKLNIWYCNPAFKRTEQQVYRISELSDQGFLQKDIAQTLCKEVSPIMSTEELVNNKMKMLQRSGA